MPSRRPGPSQTSTQESTTQGDEEQRFAEVGIIYIDGIFTFFHLTFNCYVLLLIFITNISIVDYI